MQLPDQSSLYRQETIAALSSSAGSDTKCLLRISGDSLDHLFKAGLITVNDEQVPHRIWQAARFHFKAEAFLNAASSLSLPISLCRFSSPASFTGQEMIELQFPSNPRLVDLILNELHAYEIRLAQPGEFTFRAFLAGKMDLSQAEGVMATIHAVNQHELNAAQLLRHGKLGNTCSNLVNRLAETLALLEAGIDFTDEDDVVPIPIEALLSRTQDLIDELDGILINSRRWSNLDAKPRVTMVGPPSSGKSTLFNHLLNQNRAVIDEAHGTTRDILEEEITLKGEKGQSVDILLTDIAGLDQPSTITNKIESHAQSQAQNIIAQSDLLLLFHPPEQEMAYDQTSNISINHIHLHTKSDLVSDRKTEFLVGHIYISIHDAPSLSDLKNRIVQNINELNDPSQRSQRLVLQPRHENALQAARKHLLSALVAIKEQEYTSVAYVDIEVVAADLRSALNELASLGGRVSPDDIIGKIFSKFCIGK